MGELVLPEINGIAEGTLFTDIVFIMSALYGKKFYWKEIDIFGKFNLKMNDLTMISVFIAGSLFSIISIFGVLKKVKSKKIFDALRTILIYPLFALAILSVSFLNNSVIVKEYPKFLILTFGFQFAKMMGILQLSHILGSPYKIYQPVFLISLDRVFIFFLSFKISVFNSLLSSIFKELHL